MPCLDESVCCTILTLTLTLTLTLALALALALAVTLPSRGALLHNASREARDDHELGAGV